MSRKHLANLDLFNALQKNPFTKNRVFNVSDDGSIKCLSRGTKRVKNDETNIDTPNDIAKLQAAVEDWMDEIEDMRTLNPAVEPEAAGEESKLKGILKAATERITAGTTACRITKARLEKDKPWEDEETESESPDKEGGADFGGGEGGGADMFDFGGGGGSAGGEESEAPEEEKPEEE